jgi:hypothetical protein
MNLSIQLQRIEIACEPCCKGKLKCNHERPCSRCRHRGIHELCVDRFQQQIAVIDKDKMMNSEKIEIEQSDDDKLAAELDMNKQIYSEEFEIENFNDKETPFELDLHAEKDDFQFQSNLHKDPINSPYNFQLHSSFEGLKFDQNSHEESAEFTKMDNQIYDDGDREFDVNITSREYNNSDGATL